MTKDDNLLFLNSLRKSEDKDPLHGWVSTYNTYLIILGRFFKWLYHPNLSRRERLKPLCMDLASLKRKEQSIYKPSDMWTQEDDLLFLKYCPSKRDRCYHAISRDSSCRPHELLKLKIRELLKKPWNPYIRRHSALTEKSKILKEHTLRQHAGWSLTSNMHQKYIHYFGNESMNLY